MFFLWIVFGLLLLCTHGTLASSADSEVTIEADGGVDYDIQNNLTIAHNNVKLHNGNLFIEADQIIYHIDTGLVEASGNVKVTQEGLTYQTESISYNIEDKTGLTGFFTGVFKNEPRDFKFKGETVTINGEDNIQIDDAAITRCPKEKPDYVFAAKIISLSSDRIRLKHVVLRIKGVPVFYLPTLSFYRNRNMPDVGIGYSSEDGVNFKYKYVSQIPGDSKIVFDTVLSVKGDSKAGLGLLTGSENVHNQLNAVYDLDDFWVVSDQFIANSENYLFILDGSKEFTDKENNQLGFSLTRKYWETAIGRWQASVLARQTLAKDDNGVEYGGLYSGFRLDYNPHPYIVVSYLGIKSYTDKEYRDLMEDFGLGNNLLYSVNLPLNDVYSLGLNGVYNEDQNWIKQSFSITRDSCCFKTSLTYDRVDRSWDYYWSIKF